jgi:hypothetical protein
LKPHEFLNDKEFAHTIYQALAQVLSLLLKNDTPFIILTNISHVSFEPDLPSHITKNFQPLTFFALENYTLSTARLTGECLTFEAGFGEDNFASLVSVPIGAIARVSIEDLPIFINMAVDKIAPAPKKAHTREDNLKKSLEALLNNPENKELFKK